MAPVWIEITGRKSDVWNHFKIDKTDRKSLKCNHCDTKFKNQCSPSTFKYHLEHKHLIKIDVVSGSANLKSGQPTLLKHFRKPEAKNAEVVVSRLTAVSRIPFKTLADSEDIKRGWNAQGLKIPRTRTGIRDMVMCFGNKKREELESSISMKVKSGDRFSLTTDEWTSERNRRYMGLNLHHIGSANGLGMVRVNGSMPADKGLELIIEKLGQFGLDLKKHIVALTTDGASVMKKLGRQSGILHQLCHSHGIHLAVVDVLYKKLEDENNNEYEHGEDDVAEADQEDSDDDDNSDDEDQDQFLELAAHGNATPLSDDVSVLIKKVRKIAKFFRRSPVKNDMLQREAKRQLGKELALILDSKTRWNSMLAMLKRFLELKDVIPGVLRELSVNDLFLEEDELESLVSLKESLDLIEVGVLALGRRDTSLSKADKIFEFLLANLQQQTTVIGHKLFEAVKLRIEERRDPSISGLLLFLEDPDGYDSSSSLLLEYPPKNDLAKAARDLYLRLFASEKDGDNDEDNEAEDDEDSVEPPAKKSRADELDAILSGKAAKSRPQKPEATPQEVLKTLKREFAVLESTKERPSCLEKIHKALLTIPPSSIEAERSFSAAGLFVTKL